MGFDFCRFLWMFFEPVLLERVRWIYSWRQCLLCTLLAGDMFAGSLPCFGGFLGELPGNRCLWFFVFGAALLVN